MNFQILPTTLLLLLLLIINLSRTRELHSVSKMLDVLVGEGPLKYDKTLRPLFGGPPVRVGITANVDSLGPIDEVNMNFRIDLSFRQYWKDSRLQFTSVDDEPVYNSEWKLTNKSRA